MADLLLSRLRRLRRIKLPVAWVSKLRFYWLTRDRDSFVFLFVFMLPIITLGSMLHFAHSERLTFEVERQRRIDLACLAENIYFEARGEPLAGQRAVAEVTLNRVASPRFPTTVCDVVHEENWDPIRKRYLGAFSWTELESMPRPYGIEWQRAKEVAAIVYDREEAPLTSGALFYHAIHIEPSWAKAMQPVTTIGRHIFYE